LITEVYVDLTGGNTPVNISPNVAKRDSFVGAFSFKFLDKIRRFLYGKLRTQVNLHVTSVLEAMTCSETKFTLPLEIT
jgi:hypothetical protein